ncbi:MAG: hypothetical protein ACP5US_09670 [Candidatus Kryptoniota bacterium]
MNRTSWERILKKYSESFGLGKEAMIIFKSMLYYVSGVIKEIDEDFLIL